MEGSANARLIIELYQPIIALDTFAPEPGLVSESGFIVGEVRFDQPYEIGSSAILMQAQGLKQYRYRMF